MRKIINGIGSSPDYPKYLGMNVLQDQAFPSSAAACTAIGSITAGTGFSSINTVVIAPTGGTLTSGVSPADPAQVIPTSLKNISATIVAGGSGVAIGDTFNPVGGTLQVAGPYGNGTLTAGVASKWTVTNLQVVGAVVAAAGTSGTPGAVTITGTTGTGTKWQGTAVINASGNLTGPITITVNGNYTATPTIAGDTITGGSLSGATVALTMGAVGTMTVTTAGGYVTAPPLTACPLTGAGTGTGTGVTATLVYGLGGALLTHSGNYSGAPSFTVTDSAAGTGASIATATLGGSGAAIPRFVTDPSQGSALFPTSYGVSTQNNCEQVSDIYTVYKSTGGFTVAIVGATTLSAATFDALTFS
jgi:hypothetical protein